MTIDKVRAALEHAKSCARNEYSMHVYKEALSELDGIVKDIKEISAAFENGQYTYLSDHRCFVHHHDDVRAIRSIIAPYVKGAVK